VLNKILSCILFLTIACNGNKLSNEYLAQIGAHRTKLNQEFFNAATSPIDSTVRINFKGLLFFPASEKFMVEAKLVYIKNAEPFNLQHSHNKSKPYKNFAIASFNLNGKLFKLMLMEQVNKKAGYENYIILPFTDLTNGQTTYTGGRYLEFTKPETDKLLIDFNYAFNPYCAYNDKFTCPVPPKENHLPIKIEAGMKFQTIN